jgi:xanthine/CO dehydrogenase XdhC/CoxF family maturation factor
MALATVVETRGSTYSKAGALMLIDENGVFQGMLSGGCLEGDLAIRAQIAIETGTPQLITYDLAEDNDELWGLGVGCDGLMKVLLQPLTAAQDYEPFATILEALDSDRPAVVSTLLESSIESAPVGAALVLVGGNQSAFGIADDLLPKIIEGASKALSNGTTINERIMVADNDALALHSVIQPAPRILVLGGGLDAEPLVRYADELGWKCTVVDHRPAYIEKGDFSGAERRICCSVDELGAEVELAKFDAAVVMSHHLASDRAYLEHLGATDIAYVGLLGPVGRRDRLLAELGDRGDALADRLSGPAGLDIGGRGPAVIALSIVVEIQQALAKADC